MIITVHAGPHRLSLRETKGADNNLAHLFIHLSGLIEAPMDLALEKESDNTLYAQTIPIYKTDSLNVQIHPDRKSVV